MSSGPVYVRISAETADLSAKLAVAKAEFSNTSAELRKMAQQMSAAGSSASAELKAGLATSATAAAQARANMAALNAEMRQISSSQSVIGNISTGFERMLAPIIDLRRSLAGLAEMAVAAFAVERVAHWAESVAEAGAHIGHLAQQIGVSAEEMSGLNAAFEAVGLGADKASSLLERLEKNMVSAGRGSKEEAAAFAALGIHASELKDLSIDEVLNRIAVAFQKSADGPEKTAIAITLMGRAGAEMIPFLDRGREGLEEFKKRAEETGTILTGPMIEGMERTHEKFATMGLAVKGLGISFFELFKPAIDSAVGGIADLIKSMNDSIRSGGLMADVVKVAAAMMNGLVIAVRTATFAIQENYLIIATVAKAGHDVLHGNFSKAQADVEAGWKKMKDAALDYAATVARLAQNAGSDLGAVGSDDEKPKPKLHIDEDWMSKLQSMSNASKDALREVQDLVKGTLDATAKGGGEAVKAAQQYLRDLVKNADTIDKEMAAQNKAAIDGAMKPWETAVHGVGGAFKTMFSGVLSGTQTLKQMFANLAQNIAVTFANIGIQVAEDWALTQIRNVLVTEQAQVAQTAAVAAGEATRTGIKAAAAAEGKGVEAIAGSALVFAEANKAAAGAYAAIAPIPIIGPVLAPIAAGTAFAAVMAFNVFSAAEGFDVGAGISPLTQLHPNEMVLPADIASPLRDSLRGGGVGGGGNQFHGHVHIDKIETDNPYHLIRKLKDPAVMRALAYALGDYYGQNPSTRGKF